MYCRSALLRIFTHKVSSSSQFSISHSYKSLSSHSLFSTEAKNINFNSNFSESISKSIKGLLSSNDGNFGSDYSESIYNPTIPALHTSFKLLSHARSRFTKQNDDFALLRSSSIAKSTKGLFSSLLWDFSSPEDDESDFDADSSELISNHDLQIYLQLLSQARSRFSSHEDIVSFLRSSPIARPAKGLVFTLLWELRRDWESAVLVFRWAGDGVLESPWACDLMIWVLGKHRRFDLAWMLLRRMHRKSLISRRALVIMMERYVSANETGKAIRTFNAFEKFNVKADLDAFYALLRALCKNKNNEEAEELLFSKQKFFPLETVGFNILLDGWCNILVDLVEAKRIWREMAKYCIIPDSISYTHMIICVAKHGILYESVRLYDEMKKRGCIPNLKVYNYLIYVLTKENCMREAHSIFNKIMEEGLKPDLETYNCMIFSLCEAHKLDEAREIMKMMMLGGIRPSMDTYHAFFMLENFEGMLKLIDRMKEDGIRPNRRTFLLIFDNFFGSGESESALKMWSEMSEYDVTPDRVHYITMIKGLILHGWIPKAMEFYSEMKAKGFPGEPELEKLFDDIFSNKRSRWRRDSKRYITRNKSCRGLKL